MIEDQKKILVNLGNKVKALRIERNLTLKEMAYRIDKDPQSISRLEMGGVNPSYLYLLEISRALEIEVTELLKSQ